MISKDNILPVNIQRSENLAAMDDVFAARLGLLDIENIIAGLVDNVPESVLPWLADQFDVQGYKGWKLTKNVTERRELIKNAVSLHRYKGTIFGLRRAIQSLGFNDVTILEGSPDVVLYYNGVAKYDGEFEYGGNMWATFSVTFDLGDYKGITTVFTADLRTMINEYKNTRSHLVNVDFVANLSDQINPTDNTIVTIGYNPTDDFTGGKGFTHNGAYKYNGFRLYGSNTDDLTIIITTI